MAEINNNGKQKAIDILEKEVSEIFSRLRDVEMEGCAMGKLFVKTALDDMKREQQKNRYLLTAILIILAANYGPTIIGWIARGI